MTAAHVHLLLNHIPILGSIFGLLLLCYGMLRKSDEIKKTSLGIFVITALLTIPVYLVVPEKREFEVGVNFMPAGLKRRVAVRVEYLSNREVPALRK